MNKQKQYTGAERFDRQRQGREPWDDAPLIRNMVALCTGSEGIFDTGNNIGIFKLNCRASMRHNASGTTTPHTSTRKITDLSSRSMACSCGRI